MMPVRHILALIAILLLCASTKAQTVVIGGRVVDADTDKPIEFASVLLTESGLWAVTGEKGTFTIKGVPAGKNTITVQCLGYQKRTWTMDINRNVSDMSLRLKPDNLKLDEVTVVARRKHDEATTSYTIDRTTLDNQQILNVSDLQTLLPGGKTVNPSLMNDTRIALRSAGQERGNASFGTAIEIDGLRLDNNAMSGETAGASTRTVSSSNIESVEIVTGIPSVEYGDLSNGMVKVNTRRGKSPFIVEGKLNQHTRQIAVNKGFDLSSHLSPQNPLSLGVLNVSLEHARSFSDAASPHTAYQRNILSLNYMNIFMKQTTPLTLNLGLTGNMGGYNSEADPDNELDDYQKARDNALRMNLDMQWLLNRPWLTNLQLTASYSIADRKQESYTHTSSASTQPYLHSTEEGYYMAQQLSSLQGQGLGDAASPIILGPTGYWYVLGYNDSKPASWSVKLKGDSNHRLGSVRNRVTAGVHYTGSHNEGRGTYYDDMSVAPTWREYRYDQLPKMHNVALFAEDKVMVPLASSSSQSKSRPLRNASFELTAGLRYDMTNISGSDYGTVGSLSPRFNSRLIVWRNQRKWWVNDLELHAGWGKSVKLPSFQVLYPHPNYSDLLAFASTSASDNTSFYAYYTYPSKAQYNGDLRWQYTNQTDIGVDLNIKGTRISLSAFHHKTHRSYVSMSHYTPFSYLYTPPSSLNGITIPADERRFSIDQRTGVVSVYGIGQSEGVPATALNATERRTYTTQHYYTNASPVSRYGLEWTVDFAQIKALRTQVRIDGNFYEYKGLDDLLFADIPLGVSNVMANGQPYQYVGYYRGTNVTSASTAANASVSNGSLQRQTNVNVTLTTHIPRIRLVVALRGELSLQDYRRPLSEMNDGSPRGIVIEEKSDYFGEPYTGQRDHIVALYPEYYSTWEQPDVLLPFAERFTWARDNDATLYSDLSKLVIHSNYAYTMNPNSLSRYYSANLSVTKEIGDHISVSFYANNFWNNMKRVRSSQTGLETSLFDSSYIPAYYYGLSLRLKI